LAEVYSRTVIRLTALRFFFRGLGILVRFLDVLEFFFRGLCVINKVLEVLEFYFRLTNSTKYRVIIKIRGFTMVYLIQF
jgi:hypothetical protein